MLSVCWHDAVLMYTQAGMSVLSRFCCVQIHKVRRRENCLKFLHNRRPRKRQAFVTVYDMSMRLVARGERLDGGIENVTCLSIGEQLVSGTRFVGPHTTDGSGGGISELGVSLSRFGTVGGEHAVEERDLGSHLDDLDALGVVGALGRIHQQAQEQGGHGRNQAHSQLHGVLGVRAQMMLRHEAANPPPEQHGPEQAGRDDDGAEVGVHLRIGSEVLRLLWRCRT